MMTSKYVTEEGESIGLGLHSSVGFKPGDHICKFIGEIVTTQKFGERTANGCGGYGLHYTTASVYDCYKFRNVCMASVSNTSRNMTHVVTGNLRNLMLKKKLDFAKIVTIR